MAASDCIKVVLFHHDQIFFYLLHIYCGTGYRIGVMTVYTFKFCFYTINIDYASLTVDFTDTDSRKGKAPDTDMAVPDSRVQGL